MIHDCPFLHVLTISNPFLQIMYSLHCLAFCLHLNLVWIKLLQVFIMPCSSFCATTYTIILSHAIIFSIWRANQILSVIYHLISNQLEGLSQLHRVLHMNTLLAMLQSVKDANTNVISYIFFSHIFCHLGYADLSEEGVIIKLSWTSSSP